MAQELPEQWGEWKITGEIGRGASGTVYKAERKIGDSSITSAVKVIHIPSNDAEADEIQRETGDSATYTAYFRGIVDECIREIRLMNALKGISNIVSIEDYEIEETEGADGRTCWTIYIRMEYLKSLPSCFPSSRIQEEEIIRIGIDICTALEYCEKLNIIHRDIKPDNIFRSALGQYKLGDFGVARQCDRTVYTTIGTFTYMAPEVRVGSAYGKTADIYSLGLMCYRLGNRNRDPFIDPEKQLVTRFEREAALQRRMSGEKIPALPNMSAGLSEVLLRACAFKPEDRYQSAAEMKAGLQALLERKKQTKNETGKTTERKETETYRTIGGKEDRKNRGEEAAEKKAAPDGDRKSEEKQDNGKSENQGQNTGQKKTCLKVLLPCAVFLAAAAVLWIVTGQQKGQVNDRDILEKTSVETSSRINDGLYTEQETATETEEKVQSESITGMDDVVERDESEQTEPDTDAETENPDTSAPVTVTADISGCAHFRLETGENGVEIHKSLNKKKLKECLEKSMAGREEVIEVIAEAVSLEDFVADRTDNIGTGETVTLSFAPHDELQELLEKYGVELSFSKISEVYQG